MALATTGALCTTPTDLLDAHAGLLPMDLLLKKICFRALTHICSLPLTNPVALQVAKYHTCPVKRHITNIQYLLKLFWTDPLSMENIPAMTKPPSYKLPFDITIANSKEELLEDESKDNTNIRIYTDGSCYIPYHTVNSVSVSVRPVMLPQAYSWFTTSSHIHPLCKFG